MPRGMTRVMHAPALDMLYNEGVPPSLGIFPIFGLGFALPIGTHRVLRFQDTRVVRGGGMGHRLHLFSAKRPARGIGWEEKPSPHPNSELIGLFIFIYLYFFIFIYLIFVNP